MKKQSRAEAERRERLEERRSEKRKESEERRCICAKKIGKVAKYCVFSNDLRLRRVDKIGSLKRRVRSPAGQMRDEKIVRRCGAAWSTFRSQNVQKHLSVAPLLEVEMSKKSARRCGRKSTFRSQNVQSTPLSDHFWKLRSRTCARALWREAHFESQNVQSTPLSDHFLGSWEVEKCARRLWREETFRSQNVQKHTIVGPTFGSWEVEKSARRSGRKSTFSKWKMYKNTTCSRHFWRFRCRFAWQAQRIVHLVKSEQNVRGSCSISRNDGRRGAFEEDLQRCISRGRCSTKRHVHQRCSEVRALISWEGLHFGVSDLQVCWDDFAWQVQHFVWPGINFFAAGAVLYTGGVEKS